MTCDWFPVILTESWRVLHVMQEMVLTVKNLFQKYNTYNDT